MPVRLSGSLDPKTRADFEKALADFAANSKQTFFYVALKQASLLCSDTAAFTPPLAKGGGKGLSISAKKAGEGAVEGDVSKLMVGADNRTFKKQAQKASKRTAVMRDLIMATRMNDMGAFNKTVQAAQLQTLQTLSPIMRRILNDPNYERAFGKAQNYLARAHLKPADKPGFVTDLRSRHDAGKAPFGGRLKPGQRPKGRKAVVETQAAIDAYVKERQRQVGKTKSGWLRSLESLPNIMNKKGNPLNFGGPLRKASWLAAHTSSDGYGSHMLDPANLVVTIGNRSGNVNNIADESGAERLAYGNRVKQMMRDLDQLLRKDVARFNQG